MSLDLDLDKRQCAVLREMGEPIGKIRAYGGPRLAAVDIPCVGAQSGDAAAIVRAGWRPGAPIIVNLSRAFFMRCRAKVLQKRRGAKPAKRGICCKHPYPELQQPPLPHAMYVLCLQSLSDGRKQLTFL